MVEGSNKSRCETAIRPIPTASAETTRCDGELYSHAHPFLRGGSAREILRHSQ